jgi:hypothetical protein
LKLKSAVQQYEENRKSLDGVRESVQKIGEAGTGLVESTKAIMTKIEQIGLEEKLQQLQQDSSILVKEQHQQASKPRLTQGLVVAMLALEAMTMALVFLR